MRRAGRLGDGWIPSFITPEQVRVGVREDAGVRGRPPGARCRSITSATLFYYCLDDDPARARAAAAPFVPRDRVDDATLARVHRVRPAEPRARASRAVRRGRRLEVHPAPDVPARRRCSTSSRGSPPRWSPPFTSANEHAPARASALEGPERRYSEPTRAARGRCCRPRGRRPPARPSRDRQPPDSTAAAGTAPVGSTTMRARIGEYAHRIEDLVVGHERDVGEVLLQDRERQRAGRGEPDAVGDRRRRRNRHALALPQRQVACRSRVSASTPMTGMRGRQRARHRAAARP